MTRARLSVDLDALAANHAFLERLTGRPVQPVVKADAYGLGAEACVTRLMQAGARTFFVARLSEGMALREAMGADPIVYVLDGCTEGAAAALRDAELRPVINHADQLTRWQEAGGGPCGLHIDTGMNRLGFRPEQAPPPFPGLELVMSHLACADDPASPMNAQQRDTFAALRARYPDALASFANSGGCFLGPDFAFDAVRPGISLWGGGPEGRPHPRIQPVATFSAPILQVRRVPVGESVGYARGKVADQPLTVATVGAGYADGVMRATSPRGQVFVAGALRPILGRISMDALAVDVTGLDVAEGDRVELFGPNRPIDDAARDTGTIAYELLTSVGGRVDRTYTG
ncbi:MAG: alanine racemase [Brevundimonas sp.]|uniref:alanine racemase n=1 Tax=Brevundimonas sp. TaxID=1871086 RepID=UPI002ABA52CB|nr:alanine racemase [Brevundimonas sp.]MDZ4110987.1 alanine racemase [Brevundimonas sp.]